MKKEEPKDRLQARLESDEAIEFYNDWQELCPDLDWSQFCRKMLRNGIILERIDQLSIREGRKSLEKIRLKEIIENNDGKIGSEHVVGHIQEKILNTPAQTDENKENIK